VAVNDLGLLGTAEIYGATLIALAAPALALSGRLDDQPAETTPQEPTPPGTAVAAAAEGCGGYEELKRVAHSRRRR
jgi:hypothetical protein